MPDALVLAPESTPADVARVALAARRAAPAFAAITPEARAAFLERIATNLEGLGDELLATAHRETNLPLARLTGERGRTCAQLRMFATLIRDDAWLDVRIERADPARTPAPKPDLRRTLVPIGPVAVFGASNFPLAFSVPGGDTASALAAGCPVIVKAHPAHPETSLLAFEAIRSAAEACEMPEGTVAIVSGGAEIGRALALDPNVAAVAFTGSHRAGRALFDLAAGRDRPIPVFAEMGSVNPLFLLPGALSARGTAFATAYADSLALGVGQFCTNPGILVGPAGLEFDAVLEGVAARLGEGAPGKMLTPEIARSYAEGVAARSEIDGLTCHGRGEGSAGALFSTDAAGFLADPRLHEELFGPAAVAVRCADADEMRAVAEALEGQLTATIHFEESDLPQARELLPVLVGMAGRIVANGFPTGVEVNSAMQHGGPYPATTDARFTSVGTGAIARFVRPVAFQDVPAELLPRELKDA